MSASMLAGARWKRLVILGNSSAEGDMSWTDQIIAALSSVQPEFAAFNLARPHLLASQVRITQLTAALELRPDLAFIVVEGNDITHGVKSELTVMISALRAAGTDVLTMGWPERYRELAALMAEVTKKFGGVFCEPSGDPLRLDTRSHALVADEVIRALSALRR